jgi:sugar/nucleoside kinase (ribokinase family)
VADTFEVLGVAGILPLDHAFILDAEARKTTALKELRSLASASETQPTVSFAFESYRRSGGGRIANVLAYLGSAGHKVGILGTVGDDSACRLVLRELKADHVDTSGVAVCVRTHTRIVLLLGRRGSDRSTQVHVKQHPLARFRGSLLKDGRTCQVMLIGRANSSVLSQVEDRKQQGTIVAVHVGSWPWRNAEQALHKKLLSLSDLIVLDAATLSAVKASFGLAAGASLSELASHAPARIIVSYGGLNEVHAVLNDYRDTLKPAAIQTSPVLDRTGMAEIFHGALLSFLLRHPLGLREPQALRAALGYANEIAAVGGQGVGARHFPSMRDQELRQQAYLTAAGLFRYDIALSFAGEDREVAEQLAELLVKEGVSVFYDKYFRSDLWGKDLFTHLQDVYRKQSRFCLMLVSESYKQRQWTTHERRAAQARAFEDNREYILPLRLDDVELPGLLPTDGFLDWRRLGPGEVVALLKEKLKV